MNKKRLFLFICFLLVISLSSCSSNLTLKKAFSKLNETTYSVSGRVMYKTTVIKDGEKESSSTGISFSAKCDKDKMLITYKQGLNNIGVYYKIEGDYLKSYTMKNNRWVLLDIEDIEEYDNLLVDFDYSVLGKFDKCGNIYYGDCSTLNEEAKESFISLCEDQMGEIEFELTEFGFNKYNIILVKIQLNYLDIECFMSLNLDGYSIELVVTETLRIFDIGEVVVEEPDGLPIE